MSYAFEVTAEDVETVLQRNSVPFSEDMVNTVIDQLDFDQIEKAALMCDDVDDQVESAYEEIELQLKELKII